MKKKNLFTRMLLLLALIVGSTSAWAEGADVTYDFTGSDWSVSNGTLTDGTVSFTGAGSSSGGSFKMNSGYFMMGKSGAYINFPTYSSPVAKIVVTGRTGASGSVVQNIYVGDKAVSDATTGATGTNTYEIASDYQTAGTQYTLKVTSNHNTQITKIEIYYASGTSDPSVETTVTIDATGITNTNIFTGTAAGSLSATVTAGDNVVSGATVTWSSSKTEVATINASTGVVTLVAAGKTTITASYAGVEDEYKPSSATYELTVISRDPSLLTLWEEDFSNFSAGGTYNYVLTDGGTATKIYNEALAGGESPELLVSKNNGAFQATIPLEGVSGDLTLTFKTNNGNIAVSSTTTGVSISGDVVSGESTLTISGVTTNTLNLVLKFTNTSTSNCRLDDILLLGSQVTDTRIDIATINNISPLSVNIGDDGTFTYDIDFAEGTTSTDYVVSWESSNDDVLLVDSENGEYLAGDDPGEVTITVTVEPTDDTEYKPVSKSFTVSVVDPNANDGSLEKPYTVEEVIAFNPSGSDVAESDVYVRGFIVGGFNSNNKFTTTPSEFQNSNFAIASSPNETTIIVPIQVQGDFQTSIGIKDKSYNVGVAQVLIKGDIMRYFSRPGIKNVEDITKVAEQVTVSSVGVGTYSTDVALDFRETAITAYTAVAGGTSVALTPIEGGVPANTGVVLKANGGASALVPVAATTATLETNEMMPNVARAQVSLAGSDGKTNYILSNEAAGVGFYLAAETGAYLPAHRAYLSTTTTGNAPFLGFDGEGTTGIQSITPALSQGEGVYYDLSGRRVAQPTKGIFILNGKKVVVK